MQFFALWRNLKSAFLQRFCPLFYLNQSENRTSQAVIGRPVRFCDLLCWFGGNKIGKNVLFFARIFR